MNTQKVLQKLEIGVASPKQIKHWAERFLPNGEIVGEVTSWETVNYKTLKPEPNGLFCQKTFGPIVDFTCACGKKSPKKLGKTNFHDNSTFFPDKKSFCIKCGVERTHSRVRRYRLGYIKLKQPIVHALYASHRPSPLNLCLNWPIKRYQSVMKASEFCFFPKFFSTFRSYTQSSQFFINRVQLLKILKKKTLDQKQKKVRSSTLIPKTTALRINDEKNEVNSIKTCKKAQQKKPRLFTKIKSESKKKQGFVIRSCSLSNQENEIRLYGIGYDATWRQVEEFQEFLFYLWEHSFSYESNISYYVFIKQVQTYAQEIPKHEQSYAIQTGGIAFQQILSHLNIRGLAQELENQSIKSQESIQITREKIAKLDFNYKEDRKKFKKLKGKTNKLQQLQFKCRRQLELFRDFEQKNIQPAWMVCSYLPVLPPGLRPITSIGGEFIVSDINHFYRKVLIRNKRITFGVHFGIFDTALSGSWLSWCYNIRQIQEAVDELLKTGSVEAGKPLKSLLDGLKGKRGRFRQHLLGKRVDYSGRSVIVVGPELKLYQCGLPKQMAIELFQPFIIQKLRKRKIVFTTTAAKALIAERKPIVWSILSEICRTHPILLNRAPTLHRLGIQAFLPRLVEGKAILLHPLVCPAFNADFDGDQMAVHVPLSAKTRAEALNLLWSRNNILAPASGQPILLPTQDMVLGFYYLTCSHEQSFQNLENPITIQTVLLQNKPLSKFKQNIYFSELSQVESYYDCRILSLHTKVWVKWPGFVETFITEQQANTKENSIETRIDLSGRRLTLFKENCQLFGATNLVFNFKKYTTFLKKTVFIRTTSGRILMHSCLF